MGLRLIYVIPHIVVLIFVNIAWTVTTIIAWFAILFHRCLPTGLYRFAVGAMGAGTSASSPTCSCFETSTCL